jgi:hypothetical protein
VIRFWTFSAALWRIVRFGYFLGAEDQVVEAEVDIPDEAGSVEPFEVEAA